MSQIKALSVEEALNQKGSFLWVDVRSESEFARAHIPGAINIPILNDSERAEVGTAYKQQGREIAVQVGLRLAGPKFEAIYMSLMALQKEHNKPLLFYCWRGGLRSQIASTITQWSGIPVYIIRGGYRSFRNWTFDTLGQQRNLLLLAGHTGSGKTEILHHLKQAGYSIIDLEGVAHHKGSALGGIGMPEQPRNEMFENTLAIHLIGIAKDTITFVENESRMIGLCAIPQGLWEQMQIAPSIEIAVDREVRIQRILTEYASLPKDRLIEQTQKLRKRLGGQHEQAAIEALHRDDFRSWVELLLVYYDKSYAHFVEKNNISSKKMQWDWNQIESSLLKLLELSQS